MRLLLLLLFFFSFRGFGVEPPPPKIAHDDRRFEFESGVVDGEGTFLSAGFRYGLHDLLDPVRGFPQDTAVDILHLKLRLPIDNARFGQRTFWLDQLTLFRFASLSPTDITIPERSWEVELGAATERSELCDHCIAGHVLGGLGATFQFGERVPLEFFVMADVSLSYAPGYQGFPIKPGIGPHGGLRWRVTPTWIAIFDGHYAYTFPSDHPSVYDYGTDWRWSPVRDFAFSARLRRFNDAWEWAGGALYYF